MLRQGKTALDLDAFHVEGKDQAPGSDRTFTLNVYSLALRGSTRPRLLGGLYLEGLAGGHIVNLESASSSGMQITGSVAGWLLGFGMGYAFTDDATVHVRVSGGRAGGGLIGTREFLATYWFTPHVGVSAGYKTCDYFNEIVLLGWDFTWRGPAAGLVVAF